MKHVRFPAGDSVPALGLGTWHMGQDLSHFNAEVAALRHGIELGMTLIDTAEMYADGGAEQVVGAAIKGRREGLFIVSKVLPHHASAAGTIAACEQSLARLGSDYIDLYLLHWPGQHALQESIRGFETLQQAGKIRHYGISNFDAAGLHDVIAAGGGNCQTNQLLYNPSRRGIEFDTLVEMAALNMPLMAYSPLQQGGLIGHPVLTEIGRRHDSDAAAVALAWAIRRDDVIAIPKAGDLGHVRANRAATAIVLSAADLAAIDDAFPSPTRRQHLEVL